MHIIFLKCFKKKFPLFSYTGGCNETERQAGLCRWQNPNQSPEPVVFPRAPPQPSAPLFQEKMVCISSAQFTESHTLSLLLVALTTWRTTFFTLSRYSSNGLKTPQNPSKNMQLPSRETTPYFNNVDQKDLVSYSSSRANSVPIIPSVGLDEACMQMQNVPEVTGIKWCKNSYSAELVNVSSPVSNCLIAEQQEVKILLETVQEQIRMLTDARRAEDAELASAEARGGASENTAFLPMSPTAKAEREAHFVLKSDTQRDSVLTKWLRLGAAGGETRGPRVRRFAKQEGRKLNTNYLYALI